MVFRESKSLTKHLRPMEVDKGGRVGNRQYHCTRSPPGNVLRRHTETRDY